MDRNWNERYLTHNTPWDTNQPSTELQRVLDEYATPPGRALDLGCGTGTNAVYLASRGFDVTGIDLAEAAITAAQQRAAAAGVTCRFLAADVFHLPDLGPPFDFIFDRGCFHVVRSIDEAGVVSVYERYLSPTGSLLLLTGNANETHVPQEGPPRVSALELCSAFSAYRILHLREFLFDKVSGSDYRPLAWSLMLKKK